MNWILSIGLLVVILLCFQDVQDIDELNSYKRYLYVNGIAENSDNFSYGSSIPLEYNIAFLNGGNFISVY